MSDTLSDWLALLLSQLLIYDIKIKNKLMGLNARLLDGICGAFLHFYLLQGVVSTPAETIISFQILHFFSSLFDHSKEEESEYVTCDPTI